jgi:hypothetical protein
MGTLAMTEFNIQGVLGAALRAGLLPKSGLMGLALVSHGSMSVVEGKEAAR